MKIAIDIHGVINEAPIFFSAFTDAMINAGHEIHIVTGSYIHNDLKLRLDDWGIKYTTIYSILETREAQGIEITFDENGNPWIDDELWDSAKGEYCKANNIDVIFDDTLKYSKYCNGTTFINTKIIKNK